jgi:uncharacterized repeat protein (TIGR03803 family)
MPCLSPRSSHLLFLGFRSRPSPRQILFALALFLPVLSINLSAQTLTPIYTFPGSSAGYGASGYAGLIQAADGNFYGAAGGGAHESGMIFKVTPAGAFTNLYSFTGGSDGLDPYATLIQGGDGNLYGTTHTGGANGFGTIFKISPSGKFTLLHTFAGVADGALSLNPLVQGSDGNFYGMTVEGGSSFYGSIFKITPTGTFTPLYSFRSNNIDDGILPYDGLVQGTDGNFYGTTSAGGVQGGGTVFQISSSGTYASLFSFETSFNGGDLQLPVLENSDGDFYVVTGPVGGIAAHLYTITPTGSSLMQVFEFTTQPNDGAPNPLFLASDGNLYGTTAAGGVSDVGSVFSIDPANAYQFDSLFSLTGADNNGVRPVTGLVQGSDGNFYGNTPYGGSTGDGTIFKLVPSVTPLPAPVQVTLSQSAVEPGTPVTVSFSVSNAFSLTMQQCYAFETVNNTTTTALGILAGTYSSSTKLFTGSTTVTPAAIGVYTYALTCGGIESNSATLFSGNATSTVLAATPNPVALGQPATLHAIVTGSGATPTGKVTFSVDGVTLGTATLNGSGIATLTASSKGIAPGLYPVTAVYSGNSSYKSSASAALSVTIAAYPTTTSLTVSPSPVTPPANATLTATVARISTAPHGTPTGTVTFIADGFNLGTVKLNGSGIATVAAPTNGIPAGQYTVFAYYNGDALDAPSLAGAVATVQ